MRRMLMAAFALLAVACPGHGAGYDDFTTALNANLRNDPDTAIALFAQALKSGELVPAYVAASYAGRAHAFYDRGQCKEAMTDLESLVALRPVDRATSLLRAKVKMCLGDSAGALEEWRMYAGPAPGPDGEWAFAQLAWCAGQFDAAHQAMLRALSGMDLMRGYYAQRLVLWYAMMAERAGKADQKRLAELAKDLDTREWPQAIIDFYLGTKTAEQVLDRADSWRSDRAIARSCEANFFLGEWYVSHHDLESAGRLLSAAYSQCPKGFDARSGALIELKRLGISAPEAKK